MSALSRRGVLVAGTAGAAALVAGCGGDDDEERAREARTAADLEIVRTLLRVERVATAFWSQVAARRLLEEVGAQTLAEQLARNERTHVELLERYERRLGRTPSAPPPTAFAKVLAAGATEALRAGGGLANVAAAAYLGQANRIQDRNLLASVLAIHTVEGRQAAAINRAAGEDGPVFPGKAFAEPLSMAAVRSRLDRFGR